MMMYITYIEEIEPSLTLNLVADVYICTVQDLHWITEQIFQVTDFNASLSVSYRT